MYARLSEHDHISVLFLCHSENRNALRRITFSSIKVTRKNRPKICYYNLSMKLLLVRVLLVTLWENYNRNRLSSLLNARPAGVYISECCYKTKLESFFSSETVCLWKASLVYSSKNELFFFWFDSSQKEAGVRHRRDAKSNKPRFFKPDLWRHPHSCAASRLPHG